MDPNVAGKLFAHVARDATPTAGAVIAEKLNEREVLSLLARGLSNADIAQRLFLSEGTIRNYVSSVLAKLEVKDRTQAAVIALRHGLTNFGGESR